MLEYIRMVMITVCKTIIHNICQIYASPFSHRAMVNKLVSLTWFLWPLRSFRRFTLHYIRLRGAKSCL